MAICEAGMSMGDYLTQFEFIKAFTCTYFSTAGMLVTGLFVYGAISTSIYIRTGSVVIPVVLLLLTGGAVLSQVAAIAQPFVALLILLSGAGAITYLYYRYSR